MSSPKERSSPSIESHLLKNLSTVPACRAILGYYDTIKTSNRFLDMGLTYVETGVCTVVGNVTKHSWAGSTLDEYAGYGIEKLKVQFPILEKPPKKLMTKTKRKTMKRVKIGAASVFDSRIGKMFTSGLKAALSVSENFLNGLQPHGRKTPRKQDERKDGLDRTEKRADEKNVTTVSSKEQQTEISGSDLIQQKMEATVEVGPVSKLQILLMEIVLFPLELTVELLRIVHDLIPGSTKTAPSRRSARKAKTTSISPEKKMEIESRRKVSPRKRINSSLLGNLKKVTCKMLGFDISTKKQSDIRDFIKCSKHRGLNIDPAVDGDDTEKKRKHDDMSDGSVSTDEDLMYMDLDDYESDEDPDYEPTDSSLSDVSIDSEEGVSEGELETEKMAGEMYQLKEKDGQYPLKPDDKTPAEPKTDQKATKQEDKPPLPSKPDIKIDTKIQASPKPDQKSQNSAKLDSKISKSPRKDQKTLTTGPLVEDKNKNDGQYPLKPDDKIPAEPKTDQKATKQEDKPPLPSKPDIKIDPKIQASPKPDQRSQNSAKLDSKISKSPRKDQKTLTTGPLVEDKNKNVCKQPPKGTATNPSTVPAK